MAIRERFDGARITFPGVTPLPDTAPMAVCRFCDQEMVVALSCSVQAMHQNHVRYPLVPYGSEVRYERVRDRDGIEFPYPPDPPRCGDCGVRLGAFHHLGCDVAECPICDGQLISCGCHFDEDCNWGTCIDGACCEVGECDCPCCLSADSA